MGACPLSWAGPSGYNRGVAGKSIAKCEIFWYTENAAPKGGKGAVSKTQALPLTGT